LTKALWEELWEAERMLAEVKARLEGIRRRFFGSGVGREAEAEMEGRGPPLRRGVGRRVRSLVRQAHAATALGERCMRIAWERALIYRYGAVLRRILLFFLDEFAASPPDAWKEIPEARIVEAGRASPRSVRRAIATLEADGWIERERRGGGPGCWNRYRVLRRLPPEAHEHLREALLRLQ